MEMRKLKQQVKRRNLLEKQHKIEEKIRRKSKKGRKKTNPEEEEEEDMDLKATSPLKNTPLPKNTSAKPPPNLSFHRQPR